MGKITAFMSMSLDGFIAGPKDNNKPDRELETLDRLSDWMFRGKTDSEAVEFQERLLKPVGAVVMGRRIFDLGVGPWGDNPVYHAPVFVLSHRPQEKVVKQGGTTYTFITDGAESALAQAKAAADNKDIRVVGGANTIQQFIKAGWLDEIETHLIPILLGEGIRLFENIGTDHIELEQISLTEEPGVTHIRFRIVK
jgi:dihydrofolate reductase